MKMEKFFFTESDDYRLKLTGRNMKIVTPKSDWLRWK